MFARCSPARGRACKHQPARRPRSSGMSVRPRQLEHALVSGQVLVDARHDPLDARKERPRRAAWSCPSSTRHCPLGASTRGAASRIASACRSGSPEGPKSASAGSQSRTSGASVCLSRSSMYGGLATTRSHGAPEASAACMSPSSSARRPASQASGASARALRRAHSSAAGEESTPTTRAAGSASARVVAKQPDPVPMSSTFDTGPSPSRTRSLARSNARSTRCSVSGRGTSAPRPMANGRPWNSRSPRM